MTTQAISLEIHYSLSTVLVLTVPGSTLCFKKERAEI